MFSSARWSSCSSLSADRQTVKRYFTCNKEAIHFFFPTTLWIHLLLLFLFFRFCNILLYALNSIALGSPSLTWRAGSFCTTACSAVLSAFETERKDEDFLKHFWRTNSKDGYRFNPSLLIVTPLWCVSNVTQFTISVCGLRNRKKSVWNHIPNVYIFFPKCWLILRVWWLRAFAQRRGSRWWMFVLMPADSHQQRTDGPTRDRLWIGRFDLATFLPLNSFPPSVFPSSSDRRRHSPFSCVASKLPGV